jgi:hypothetical protein
VKNFAQQRKKNWHSGSLFSAPHNINLFRPIPMSVRLSIRMEQLGSPLKGFSRKFPFWFFFRKYVKKISVSSQTEYNDSYFTFLSHRILLRIIIVSDQIFVLNRNTFCVQKYFFLQKSTLYGIIWKKHMPEIRILILRMRFARSVTKATNTHIEYMTLIAFPWQWQLRERVSILLQT